jgi:hypothetical protein
LFKEYHTCARSFSLLPLPALSPFRPARRKPLKKPLPTLLLKPPKLLTLPPPKPPMPPKALPTRLPKPPKALLTPPLALPTLLLVLLLTPLLPSNRFSA